MSLWAITRDSATVFKLSNFSSSLIFTKELNFLKDSVNVICPVCESVLQASSLTHLVSVLSSSLFLDSAYIFCHTVFILCESHWFTERLLSKLAVFNRKPTWQVFIWSFGECFWSSFLWILRFWSSFLWVLRCDWEGVCTTLPGK